MTVHPKVPSLHASEELLELAASISSMLQRPAFARVLESPVFRHGAHALLVEVGGLKALSVACEEGELGPWSKDEVPGSSLAAHAAHGSTAYDGEERINLDEPAGARVFLRRFAGRDETPGLVANAIDTLLCHLDDLDEDNLDEDKLGAAVEGSGGLEVDAETVAILKAKLGPRVCATCGRGPDNTVVYRAVQDLVLCDGCVERAELAAKGRAHAAQVKDGPRADEVARARSLVPEPVLPLGEGEAEAAKRLAVGPASFADAVLVGRALGRKLIPSDRDRLVEALTLAGERVARTGCLA